MLKAPPLSPAAASRRCPGELSEGNWVQPTIWTGLSDDSVVIREEIFGPCCHIRPFDTEEEAIALANDTPYGLAAALWTENLTRAHRVAAAMDVGLCWVNSWFLRDLRTPFGGSKQSGHWSRGRSAWPGVLRRTFQCLHQAVMTAD